MHAFSTTARLTVPHRAQQQSSVSVNHLSRGVMRAMVAENRRST
jgi:hypothetical protein